MDAVLFTKRLCGACQKIKADFDLKALGVDVEELDNNPGALALLAWHELVDEAKKSLPILVIDNGTVLKDEEVAKELSRMVETLQQCCDTVDTG